MINTLWIKDENPVSQWNKDGVLALIASENGIILLTENNEEIVFSYGIQTAWENELKPTTRWDKDVHSIRFVTEGDRKFLRTENGRRLVFVRSHIRNKWQKENTPNTVWNKFNAD